MKKLIFFVMLGFILISCTRAGNSENSKIQLKLPDQKTSYGKVGALSEPSSLNDLNCYMVFVGGPEFDLQKNICPTKGNSASGIPSREIKFGLLFGGYAPAAEISIDVPSGNDRVLHLVGMHVSAPEICRDFKTFGFPSKDQSSRPYIIGSADRVLLEPSKTVEVPIKMAFDSAQGIEKCSGPDVPSDTGDGDGSGGSNEPYLRFEGLGRWNPVSNKDLATVNRCYPVTPAIYQNGSPWIDPNMTVIDINVTTFNGGQFYSDPSCSTSITNLQIPAGQNQSITNYYFKAPTSLNNVTLSGWSVSGSSVALATGHQAIDIGLPKITFRGPDKLPLASCTRYLIQSQYFEGGPLNVAPGGLTVNLTDNASFYLRALSDCSTGTTVSIAPATSEYQVFLKLMSATPVGLEQFVSAPGYVTSNFTVQNSLYNDHADAIQVLPKDNVIVRGECNPITIRLINADGGAASAKNLMKLFAKTVQGAGAFFTLPDCTGAPIDSIPLVFQESEITIGFKANSLPSASLIAGKLPFIFHFGSIRIKDTAFALPSEIAFTVVDPMDPWFAHVTVPSFNGAEIVGTHEFSDGGGPDTYKELILNTNYSQLESIECSNTPMTGFSACPGSEVIISANPTVTPYKYRLSSTNAATPVSRYVRFNFNHNGHTGSKEIQISPTALYGANFKVIQCGSIAAVNEFIENLNSHSSGVVCLPASSTHTRSSPTAFTFTPSTRTGLIGHSSGTSELNGTAYGAVLIYPNNSNSPDANFYIANLRLRSFNSSSAIGIADPIVTAPYFGEINNVDIDDLGSGSSVNLISISNNDPDMNIRIRNSKIKATGASNTGISISSANKVFIENTDVESSGFYGIYISNSSSFGNDISIRNSNIKVTNGSALYLSSSGAANGSNIQIQNSKFKIASPGSPSSPVVKITNKVTNLIFDNNIVESDPSVDNDNLVRLYSNNASNELSLFMRANTFLQGNPSKSILRVDGTFNIDISEFHDNSLVTTALVANNGIGFVDMAPGAFFNVWTNISNPVGGGNVACSNNASYIFTTPYTTSGGLSGGLGLGSIPVIMNNMSANSKRCSGNYGP